MIVVASGEGPSDLGACNNTMLQCQGTDFSSGPLIFIIDNIINDIIGYSPIEVTPSAYRYYSEGALVQRARARKNQQRFSLAGRKHGQETGYYFINAWMLGEICKDLELLENDLTLAVLFRDSDGTNITPTDEWDKKYLSMIEGFKRAAYERGVPMLPRPKSEAWLLCAVKEDPYQHCATLENMSGNDESPRSLKDELSAALGVKATTQVLNAWLENNGLDHRTLAEQMPSFKRFFDRAKLVLESLTGRGA